MVNLCEHFLCTYEVQGRYVRLIRREYKRVRSIHKLINERKYWVYK